jgi:tetratricopeptide (TPR) repeat protein
VIERPENKALGFVWRGTFFANLSLWKKAAESFKQALSSDPSDYRAWTNLGAAYHQLGQLEHAEVAYQSALAITKRYAPTHANLGLLYEKVGNTDQAGQEFERALRLNRTQQQAISGLQRLHSGVSGIAPSTDNEAINLLNEGNSFSQQSRHEEAKESYQAALVLDDTMAIAHLNLGIIYAYHLPDPNKAIEHWQRYLDLEPGAEDRAQIEAAIGQLVRQQIAAQQDTGQNQ